MSKNKKILWAIIIIVLVVGVALGCLYGQKWWTTKQAKIQLGLSSDKFPWRDYTQTELDKMYPQIKYADIPTRVTPEETYAKFREALQANNLELALEQFNKEGKAGADASNNVRQFYNENKFKELYDRYPESIKKISMYEALAQYEYTYFSNQYEQELIGTISFAKDVNGDWKMDSL